MADILQSFADVIPSHLKHEVERELLRGWNMRAVKAQHEAKQIAQFGHSNEAKNIDGVGKLVARIPPDAFHMWGIRLGYECWEDKQFLKEFLRDNPEVAVRNYCKKTVVGGAVFDASGFLIK
jgi:hypothetical protein